MYRHLLRILPLILALPLIARADYVQLGDLELYYQEAGQGQPLVFVPGWTMTTRYFQRQLEHYRDSDSIRAIVYDPRAHGRSGKTLEGANYHQHAKDLKAFIEALELQDVVIAGWSWGGITVYSYLDQFGAESLRGAILIDQTPTPLTMGDLPWVDGDPAAVKGFFDGLTADRIATNREFIPWMFTTELSAAEQDWMLAETLMTPAIVASQLLYDGWMADWTPTLALELPMLHVVREENAEAARGYLAEHDPDATVVGLGGHGMFYDHAEAFNEAVDNFLGTLE